MALTPRSVFRYYETDGVPSSGKHEPIKAEIIQLLESLFGVSRGGWVVAQTLDELNAVTPESETDGGVVLADPDPANNGYYDRDESVWVKGRGFPDTFARVELSGSGTAQAGAIRAGVNPADIEVFFAFVETENTGALTLAIGGEAPRQVVNLAGEPLSAGEWSGAVMFALQDGKYQLLLDAGAAASAAQSASDAKDDADRAEAEADRAEASADSAALSSAAAGAASGRLDVASFAELAIKFVYSDPAPGQEVVAEGDVILWREKGFAYRVLGVSATDAHLDYSGVGGVKLMALPDVDGFIATAQMGAAMDDATDDAPVIEKTLLAAISSGCNARISKGGIHLCTSRIGTFDNIDGLIVAGWGAVIRNANGINVEGLWQFGNPARDEYNMYTESDISVRGVKVFGIKFLSSGDLQPGNDRWADQQPLQFNTAQDCYVGFCEFHDQDFASIDFGALCRDISVENCLFRSSRTDAGHANYGVRVFCYANYTSYQNGNGDLSPIDTSVTGVLKSGYALVDEQSPTWGHERINVRGCTFENMSHGVMLSAARFGDISGNFFINPSTRGVSLTTYSQHYSCANNLFYLDTNVQQATISTFVSFGQETYGHRATDNAFIVIGEVSGSVSLTPVRAYLGSHDWLVSRNSFEAKEYDLLTVPMMLAEWNSDGEFSHNRVDAPLILFCFTLGTGAKPSDPTYTQKAIRVIGNKSNCKDFAQVYGTTTAKEPIFFENNEHAADTSTRFIAHVSGGVSGNNVILSCRGNKFTGGSVVRYIDNISTAIKAVLLEVDVIEIRMHQQTAGLAPGNSQSATFDWSDYSVPACFNRKSVEFTAYGDNPNGTMSGDISFTPTAFTARTISGTIARASGGSGFMLGNVGMTVRYLPLIT